MTLKLKTDHKKNKVASFAEVWECPTTKDKSLHATVDFFPGEVLSSFGAREILAEPNYLSLQTAEHQHILLDPEFLQYINHSCDPNVYFDTTNMIVTALRKIGIGEELTFFYPSTEWSMDRGFDCHCGSHNCLRIIQGAAHLPLNVLKEYKLSQYIQEKLAQVDGNTPTISLEYL
ncbi:MAG: SET domain-containing protein [Symploca sp. SIO1C2]|nr:SET domain-containing protein [Symploca sp. SIO1C2]